MKAESTCVKPVFVPVTITLESVEELNFFRDVMGRTNSRVADAYGISNDTLNDIYGVLSAQCTLQSAPGYMSRGYEIKYEKKGD